ncbi:MAG: PaaI family thioesterase [Anaerolineae bacterium]|nr:PaaI family thioesterase [Anaerolineae bacterium]MDW8172973.1 PaaI family thioesterase [Anaerolineae bacterium]
MSDRPLQPIQNFYRAETAICYGCGRNNAQGLHIQTYWDGQVGVCHFTPRPEHTAFPGVVYGGLLASLIDCHTIGTAIAAMHDAEGRAPGSEPEITCVTGYLNVRFHKPTPMGPELRLEAHIAELSGRKGLVKCELFAEGMVTVSAEVLAVRVTGRTLDDVRRS